MSRAAEVKDVEGESTRPRHRLNDLIDSSRSIDRTRKTPRSLESHAYEYKKIRHHTNVHPTLHGEIKTNSCGRLRITRPLASPIYNT
jgi:hypothetical protein